MGRFLAIVLVLVAIALLVNSWQSNKTSDQESTDDMTLEVPEVAVPTEPDSTDTKSAKSETAKAEPAPTTPADSKPAKSETSAQEAAEPEQSPDRKAAPAAKSGNETSAKDSSAKDSSEKTSAAEDVPREQPAVEVAAFPQAAEAVRKEDSLIGIAVADPEHVEGVMLGGVELLSGIPGEGDLTLEQIESWLRDPRNRVVLKPELPLGLAAGAGAIQGIEGNPLTRAKIELGRQLYFDPRLSSDSTISCASCHDPKMGYAKNTRFGIGVRGQEGARNSPVAYNRILSSAQFWDGRASSLEDQAVGPIANPIEMGNTHEVAVKTIADVPGYKMQFDAVFADGLSIENVAKAIASFERTIVTGPTPWDHYQKLSAFERAYAIDLEDLEALQEEDEELYNDYMALKKASEDNPISEAAIRGGELFFSDKAGCTACHVGANFTDEKYHNLGVGMDAEKPDLGRFEQTGEDVDRGAFKTPTVRNVAQTAPYMHDGSQKTLEEVVEWYAKGGHPNPYLSDKIKKLELTDQDKADLVAFMKVGLTGSLPDPEQERLPK